MKVFFMRLLIITFIATLVLFFVLKAQGKFNNKDLTPLGMVSIEFAESPIKFDLITEEYGREMIRTNIFIDFIFIFAYVAFLFLACRLAAESWENKTMKSIGNLMAPAVILAGVFDTIENILMLVALEQSAQFLITGFYWAAYLKFILVALATVYLIISIPVIIRNVSGIYKKKRVKA